jgi:hypothetical protein
MSDTDPDTTRPGRSRFGLRLNWLTMGLICMLVYEVTAMPELGAAMACIKFGWDDFRSARWLRRTDPVRPRARACYWLYLAAGLWKAAATGVLIFFLVVFLTGAMQAQQPQGNPPPDDGPPPMLFGAFLVSFFGFGFSTLASYMAVWHACRSNTKLWLNSAVHRAREEHQWPPLYGQVNQAGKLFVTAMFVTTFVLVPMAVTLLIAGLEAALGPIGRGAGAAVGILTGLFVIISPVAILSLRGRLYQLVLADSPEQCWGTQSLDELTGREVFAHGYALDDYYRG